MSSISFKLEQFEGPLDLLLHLITKHKLNIYDIEISKLLEQYLLFIEDIAEQDFDYAGEFLEMAAKLIYIKTASMLPRPEEAEQIKKELQGALIEYSICKTAAKLLFERFIGGDISSRNPMNIEVDNIYKCTHSPQVLYQAYIGISSKNIRINIDKSNIQEKFNTIVNQRFVSVTTKVVFILRKLYAKKIIMMDEIYNCVTNRSERVATFLAVLELTKSGRIRINDDNTEIRFVGRQNKIVTKI